MKLGYRYYGDPILRAKAKEVTEITDEVRKIVADMLETMKTGSPGWGLAAPQVGHSVRIFISCCPDSREESVDHYGPYQVYINPKLSNPSQEIRIHPEGCFSVPKVYPDVARPAGITIEAMGLDGKLFKKELWGWQARVIMHENDHLNGVLHIDRISPRERRKFEPLLRDIKKRAVDALSDD